MQKSRQRFLREIPLHYGGLKAWSVVPHHVAHQKLGTHHRAGRYMAM